MAGWPGDSTRITEDTGVTEGIMGATDMATDVAIIMEPELAIGLAIMQGGAMEAATHISIAVPVSKNQITGQVRIISIIKQGRRIRQTTCTLAKEGMFIKEIIRVVIIKTSQILNSDQVNSRAQTGSQAIPKINS